MRIIFSPIAVRELADAVNYLDQQFDGLGERFREEVKNSLALIDRYPQAWSTESADVRRFLLHRFPYKILYSIEADHIYILAIAHQHREPDYWVDR